MLSEHQFANAFELLELSECFVIKLFCGWLLSGHVCLALVWLFSLGFDLKVLPRDTNRH